jgi:hypothetical protein
MAGNAGDQGLPEIMVLECAIGSFNLLSCICEGKDGQSA